MARGNKLELKKAKLNTDLTNKIDEKIRYTNEKMIRKKQYR